MTARPDPAGLLMHDAWRADAVLAHRIEIAGGPYAPGRVRTAVDELLGDRLDELAFTDVGVLASELVTDVPLPREEGGGNGLVMLSRMSSSWGVAGDDGTCVWFERVLPPSP